MHLTKLSLQDFRSFAKADFDFTAGLNVVVAANGVGKTSLVDALGITIAALRNEDNGGTVEGTDLRATYDQLGVTGTVRHTILTAVFSDPQGDRLHEQTVVGSPIRDARQPRVQIERSLPTAPQLEADINSRAAAREALPVHVVFGARRGQVGPGGLRLPSAMPGPISPIEGWRTPARVPAIWHQTRTEWWRVESGDELASPVSAAVVSTIRNALFRSVQGQPADAVPEEDERPKFSSDLADFMVRLPDEGWRPVQQMSDGWRGYVSMVVAIALRAGLCHQGNPDAGSTAVGTVVIDELEQHLHPRLQQEILGGLRRAFPKLQFIVTTHSPLVLTDALGERDRIIRLNADDSGTPTLDVLDAPVGRDIEAIVTGQWFGLLTTLDDGTIELLARHRAAIRRRAEGLEVRAALEQQLKERLPRFHPHGLEGFALELAAEVEGRFGAHLHTWDDLQRVRANVLRLIDQAVER